MRTIHHNQIGLPGFKWLANLEANQCQHVAENHSVLFHIVHNQDAEGNLTQARVPSRVAAGLRLRLRSHCPSSSFRA